jgi:uncharacterized membrane protein YdjX (TVP38/TMEM64 family)
VLLVVVLGRRLADALPEAMVRIEGLGIWGPAAFVAIYACAAVLLVPGSILTLAGGAIFGLWKGVLVVFVGAAAGATLAFAVARHVARDAVRRRLARSPRLAAIDGALTRDARTLVLLLRLSPLIPYNLLNYALGATSIRYRDYAIGLIGMLPATFLYVYYGKAAGEVALAAGREQPRDAAYWLVLGIGLAATVVATTYIARAAASQLRSRI